MFLGGRSCRCGCTVGQGVGMCTTGIWEGMGGRGEGGDVGVACAVFCCAVLCCSGMKREKNGAIAGVRRMFVTANAFARFASARRRRHVMDMAKEYEQKYKQQARKQSHTSLSTTCAVSRIIPEQTPSPS